MASKLLCSSFSCKTRLAVLSHKDAHEVTNRAQQKAASAGRSCVCRSPLLWLLPPQSCLGNHNRNCPFLSRRWPSKETERQAVRTSRVLAGRLLSSERVPSRLACHTFLPHIKETPRQPQIGTCRLPLQGLNRVLPQLLICNKPLKRAQGESRNEALCAPGKLAEQVFREIFSGADFMSPILVSPHI